MESTPSPSILSEAATLLFGVWKEMFAVFVEYAPKFFSIVFWALLGIIVLPCVFIANTFFPMWVKWGEGF